MFYINPFHNLYFFELKIIIDDYFLVLHIIIHIYSYLKFISMSVIFIKVFKFNFFNFPFISVYFFILTNYVMIICNLLYFFEAR